MVAKQLAKLKDLIKELLENDYIHPSSPHGSPYGFHPEEVWYSTDVHVLPCSE
jgi:hypothetical protein